MIAAPERDQAENEPGRHRQHRDLDRGQRAGEKEAREDIGHELDRPRGTLSGDRRAAGDDLPQRHLTRARRLAAAGQKGRRDEGKESEFAGAFPTAWEPAEAPPDPAGHRPQLVLTSASICKDGSIAYFAAISFCLPVACMILRPSASNFKRSALPFLIAAPTEKPLTIM